MPTDRPLDVEELARFHHYRELGLDLLGLRASDPPQEIVRAVDQYVYAWQCKRSGFFNRVRSSAEELEQTARSLAVAWGDQIVRRFDWLWLCEVRGDEERYAVAAPDRSLVIYAPHFISTCLENPRLDCTVMLAFNMQEAGGFSGCRPHEYVDVMSGVRRIVPRR